MSTTIEKKGRLRKVSSKTIPSSKTERTSLSLKICEAIESSGAFRAAAQVGIFHPLEREVDLTLLWKKHPKKCAFPRVVPGEKSLQYYLVDSLSDLKDGYGGILEPPGIKEKQVKWQPKDIILVPGIAFDHFGGRIGTGLGFYDRFLAQLPPGVQKWGVCWSLQIQAGPIELESHDIRMDVICSDVGLTLVGHIA